MHGNIIVFPTAGGHTFAWFFALFYYAPEKREVFCDELARIVRHEPSPEGQDPEIRAVVLKSLELWKVRMRKWRTHGRR